MSEFPADPTPFEKRDSGIYDAEQIREEFLAELSPPVPPNQGQRGWTAADRADFDARVIAGASPTGLNRDALASPDAPRAGGETPTIDDAQVERWRKAITFGRLRAPYYASNLVVTADQLEELLDARAALLDRPAPPIADRELPDTLRRFGRGAKRFGMMQEHNEDARWFAELHAFLDMAAIEIESLRSALPARHRDGERLDRTLRNLRAAVVTENPEWDADDTAVIGIRVTRDFYDKTMSSTTPASPPAASEPTEAAPPSPERASK